jgi:hypothetical protein
MYGLPQVCAQLFQRGSSPDPDVEPPQDAEGAQVKAWTRLVGLRFGILANQSAILQHRHQTRTGHTEILGDVFEADFGMVDE